MLMNTLIGSRWCQPCPDGAEGRRVGPLRLISQSTNGAACQYQKVITALAACFSLVLISVYHDS